MRRVDMVRTEVENIHIMSAADKKEYTVSALLHMAESSRFPSPEELTLDENGNPILSDQDPYNLGLSSSAWVRPGYEITGFVTSFQVL